MREKQRRNRPLKNRITEKKVSQRTLWISKKQLKKFMFKITTIRQSNTISIVSATTWSTDLNLDFKEISWACPFILYFFKEGQDSPAMRLTGLMLLCLASVFMQLANSKFYLIETADTKSKIVLLLLIYISQRGWTGE
jgi:hypothetical protein